MPEDIKGLNEEALTRILTAVLASAQSLNPLDKKRLDQELAREKAKDLARAEMGKAEDLAFLRKKFGCSHSRWPMASGVKGGLGAPRGEGEYCTGGQLHSDGTATLVCLRCSWSWRFQPTLQERDYIEQNGMLGWAPPADNRVIGGEDIAARIRSIEDSMRQPANV